MLDALQRSLDLSDNLGAHAVEVGVLDDSAIAFCVKYGLKPLLDHPKQLVSAFVHDRQGVEIGERNSWKTVGGLLHFCLEFPPSHRPRLAF